MAEGLASEPTTVAATYSTRRDAEVAQSRLRDEGIESFISADDAGGMHPQLQQTQGVKLVVLQHAAAEAHAVLDIEHRVGRKNSGEAPAVTGKKIRFVAVVIAFLVLLTSLLFLIF